MNKALQNQRFFKHYKNKPYRVINIVRHSETLEELVLYESLYENQLGRLWVRPKAMFYENVQVEGVLRPRFKPEEIIYKTASLHQAEVREIFLKLYSEVFGEALPIERLDQKIQQHGQLHLLLALDHVEVVGFKVGYKTDHDTFYSWLGGVRPLYRGLGIAQELMRRQHLYCELEKIKLIKTKTRSQFAEMLVLNLRAGFRITEHKDFKNGQTEILMEKRI